MLKLLFAQHQHSASGNAAKYFLDFADEVNADVTVLKPSRKRGVRAAICSLSRSCWRYGRFSKPSSFICEVEDSSRIFSYDLILVGQEEQSRWFKNNTVWDIVKTAWAPVLLMPKQNLFRPFEHILFINNQDNTSGQPILRKLGGLWDQRHFLYPPKRRRYNRGSYGTRRFDETGYPVFPRLDASRLSQYIQRHEIGLVVGKNLSGPDRQVLKKLPVPILAFNSRNWISPQSGTSPKTVPMVQKLFWIGKT